MTASLLGTGVQFPNNVTQVAPYLSNGNNLLANGDMRVSRAWADNFLTNTNVQYSSILEGYLSSFVGVTNSGLVRGGMSTTDIPAGTEYVRSFQISSGATGCVPTTTTGYGVFGTRIGPDDMRDLNWGTASAKNITLSFWVKSTLTGTYNVCIFSGQVFLNTNAGFTYPATYTINTANTWEFKTITIPGPTSGGQWTTGNQFYTGMQIVFPMTSGATFNSGTANTWNSVKVWNTSGCVLPMQTANTVMNFCGMSVEIGSNQVTPYSLASQPNYADKVNIVNRYSMVYGGNNASTNPTFARSTGKWQALGANQTTIIFDPTGGWAGAPTGSNYNTTNITLYHPAGSFAANTGGWNNFFTPNFVGLYSTSFTIASGTGGNIGMLANSGAFFHVWYSLA